ncbi:glycosyltransferase family 4 protein [Idiomarina sp. A28L]|uniref:glycosyltransferase family 4 protein n=1 Tax=Idiomarina sp. A28L TaxID=1036674 RepID=UPI001111DF19|nr:glycosyltransferase family 4 protein [Idiomarina sp. A28L]
MKKVIYISFICKHHIGVRKKIEEQVNEWRNTGIEVLVVNDLCGYGAIIKYLYRYYTFIKFFLFRCSSDSFVYIRQTVSLPLFGVFSRLRKYSYEVNADISKEASTLSIFQKILFLLFKDSLLKNADKVFFVTEELKSRYQNSSKFNYVFPNCLKKLGSKKKLPRGRDIVFVGNENQKWQGVDIFYEFVKALPMFNFHVVGNISRPLNFNCHNIVFHGILDGTDYFNLMSEMDFAIGTLAFYRSGLSEGSALKVRDYVAFDLPIVAGYFDTDFSASPFYLTVSTNPLDLDIEKIQDFFLQWERKSIHDYLDKANFCKNRESLRVQLICC